MVLVSASRVRYAEPILLHQPKNHKTIPQTVPILINQPCDSSNYPQVPILDGYRQAYAHIRQYLKQIYA